MKKVAVVLGLFLCLTAPTTGRQGRGVPKMVRPPFHGGDASHVIEEAALSLKEYAGGPNDSVAIRVCSKEPLPVALFTATVSPFSLLDHLDHYGFARERILFLRSEDCLGPDPSVALTEFWALPEGTTPPPSAEAVRASRARYEVVKTGDTIKGARGFDAALKELIARLRAAPGALGVVVGSYNERPSRALRRNLRVAARALEQNGVPAGRFYVRAAPDSGVHDGGDPEATYPNLFVVEITRGGSGK